MTIPYIVWDEPPRAANVAAKRGKAGKELGNRHAAMIAAGGSKKQQVTIGVFWHKNNDPE